VINELTLIRLTARNYVNTNLFFRCYAKLCRRSCVENRLLALATKPNPRFIGFFKLIPFFSANDFHFAAGRIQQILRFHDQSPQYFSAYCLYLCQTTSRLLCVLGTYDNTKSRSRCLSWIASFVDGYFFAHSQPCSFAASSAEHLICRYPNPIKPLLLSSSSSPMVLEGSFIGVPLRLLTEGGKIFCAFFHIN